MPRQTAKFKAAMAALRYHNEDYSLPFDQRIIVDRDDQEAVYTALQQHGYFWNSTAKIWEFSDPKEADPPTPLVMLRVWAGSDQVEDFANTLDTLVRNHFPDWKLIERSRPYQCRPPKQQESRVYLKYLPEDE